MAVADFQSSSSSTEVILFSPVKSFNSLCIFCLRKFNKSGANSLIQKFVKSVQRYLLCNDSLPDANLLLSNINCKDVSIGTCKDCSLLLQDVCELYDKINLLEMTMNWKLENLKAIITSADKVPSREKELRRILKGNKPNENKENVKKFRDGLVRKTSQKLKAAFPKVRLKRCKTRNETDMALETIMTTNGPIETDIESHNLDLEIEVTETEAVPYNSDHSHTPPRSSNGIERTDLETGIDSPLDEHDDHHSDIDNENYEDLLPSTTPFVEDGNSENGILSTAKIVKQVGDGDDYSCNDNDADFQDSLRLGQSHNNEEGKGRKGMSILQPEDLVVQPPPSKQPVPMASLKLETPNTRENISDQRGKVVGRSSRKDKRKCNSNDQGDTGKGNENSKRKCTHTAKRFQSIKTVTNSKLLPKLKTSLGIDDSAFSTLKLLSLEKVLNTRFSCNVDPCKSRTFRNAYDFRKHSLHHGKFECSACKQVMTYAPNLCAHEIRVHVISGSEPQAKYKCSRCDHQNHPERLKLHILKAHLNLSPDKETCPICHLSVKGKGTEDQDLIQHFLDFHDLSKVDYKSILKCDEENCQAYFRTRRQYTQHRMVAHPEAKNLPETFHCEDCNLNFPSNLKLLKHKQTVMHLNKLRKSFPCPHEGCGKIFKSDAELCRHSAMHTNKLRFCQACKKMVIAKNWRFHTRSIKHKNGTEKMKIKTENVDGISKSTDANKSSGDLAITDGDGKDFFRNAISKAFAKLHEGEFKCNFCDFIVTDVRELPFHEMTHQSRITKGKEKLICSRCSFSSLERNRFISHFLKSHLDWRRKIECPICDRALEAVESKEKDNLRMHLKKCHDPSKTKYSCDETNCRAFFNSNYLLLLHRNKHLITKATVIDSSGNTMLECYVCKKSLKSLPCLEAHLKRCHPEDERLKTLEWKKPASEECICDTCGRAFATSQGLLNHVKVHARDPNRLTCDICQKSFKDKSKLKRHLLSHSGPDSWEFTCDVCGRKCIAEKKLKDHQKTHDKNAERFTCDICGSSYAQRHNLRIHINSKHGDVTTDPARPYKKVLTPISRKGRKFQKRESFKSSEKSKRGRKRCRITRFSSSGSESD